MDKGSPNPSNKSLNIMAIIGTVIAIITAVATILALFEGWKCWRRRRHNNQVGRVTDVTELGTHAAVNIYREPETASRDTRTLFSITIQSNFPVYYPATDPGQRQLRIIEEEETLERLHPS